MHKTETFSKELVQSMHLTQSYKSKSGKFCSEHWRFSHIFLGVGGTLDFLQVGYQREYKNCRYSWTSYCILTESGIDLKLEVLWTKATPIDTRHFLVIFRTIEN